MEGFEKFFLVFSIALAGRVESRGVTVVQHLPVHSRYKVEAGHRGPMSVCGLYL